MAATSCLCSLITLIKGLGKVQYYIHLCPKKGESQDKWIEQLELGEFLHGKKLDEHEWKIMCGSCQGVNNYFNYHSSKQKHKLNESSESFSKHSRKDCEIDLTVGVKGIFLPTNADDLVWTGDRGMILKTYAPAILEDGKSILQEEVSYLEQISSDFGFVEGTNEHIIFLDPDTPDILSTI
ncbi:hypothetical protein VKT23_018598 [Stygiomarasmius scandens]|uniref:Uncharacterized protein n=1 Tax=Marasmiellus scandens TaxID=2682957 RepID=A0ABR1IQ58_9AGAR